MQKDGTDWAMERRDFKSFSKEETRFQMPQSASIKQAFSFRDFHEIHGKPGLFNPGRILCQDGTWSV